MSGVSRADFPLPDTDWPPLAPFWAAAATGRLRLPRCRTCGRLCWYPKVKCPHCGHDEFEWSNVVGRGRLFSWAVVRQAFLPQFREKVPFITGLIALEEDPSVRLATEIVDCLSDQLEVEQMMEVVFRRLAFAGIERTVAAPLWRPA